MKRNKGLLITLACIMLFMSGCSNGNTISQHNSSNGTIKIYLMNYDASVITEVSSYFSKLYPGCNADIKSFDDYTEYKNNLNTELLAGGGPDVILFTPYTFDSINKTIKTNAFCDINPYIESDKSFNMSCFNKKVMDCGIFDGKRYIIPLDYYISGFITTEELLQKNGISFNTKEWNMKQLVDQLKAFIEKDKNYRSEYFFNSSIGFDTYAVSSGLLNFIDYEKSEVNFDNPEFRYLLKSYKDIFSKVCAPDDVSRKYGYKYWEMMKGNSTVAMLSSMILNPEELWMYNSTIKQFLNNEMKVYPFPAYNKSDGYIAQPNQMAAINNNSKNKKIAFGFISTLLSKDMQIKRMNSQSQLNAPVNDEACNEIMNKRAGESGKNESIGLIGKRINSVAIPEALVNDTSNIKSNLAACVIYDANIIDLMYAAVYKYVKGEYSEDQVVKELENKSMLYLNE